MKIRDFFCFNNSKDKYDVAIRMCYTISFVIGFIVFVSNGLEHMDLGVWLLAFVCSTFGALVFGTIAKSFINMKRNKEQGGGKVEAEQIMRLIYIVVFALATVGFISAGMKEGNLKAWIISFIGAYGGATICAAIVRTGFTLARKD